MPTNYLVVFCTCPNAQVAEDLAEALVESGHAACVNIVPNLTSIYRWKGTTQKDQEALLIIKTTVMCYAGIEAIIQQHHPYELPEAIAVSVEQGLPAYLQWISNETKQDR